MEQRRFLVSDLMVLILATAAGLVGTRDRYREINFGASALGSLMGGLEFALEVFLVTCPMVAMWSLAVLVLRLRRPRPRWSRLARQPGFVACLLAGNVTIMVMVVELLILAGAIRLNGSYEDLYFLFLGGVGFLILGAWIAMMLARGCRPEKSWIDWAGRILGLLWIGGSVLLGAVLFLSTVQFGTNVR